MKKIKRTLKELIFDTIRVTPRTVSIRDILNFKDDSDTVEERRVMQHMDRVLEQ